MKKPLTKVQEKIFSDLIDKKLTVREIAEARNVSLQAVYSQLKLMVKKGWLKKEYSANYVTVIQ